MRPCVPGTAPASADAQRGRDRQGHFLGFQFLADFGADAHQVGPCRLRVAPAEGHAHARLDVVRHRYRVAAGIEADDVPHHHVGAEVPGAPDGIGAGFGQAHQGRAQRRHRGLRLVQRDAGVAQQHVQRGLAVQLDDQVGLGIGDHPLRRHRLAALRHPRHQRNVGAESDARQAAAKDPAGCPLALDVAVAANGELHRLGAAGRQPAEQVAGGRALRHLRDELGHVRRAGIGMDQRGVRLESHAVPHGQRCDTGKHAVLVGRQRAQHHGQRGLVEILDVGRSDADAHGAGPVGHFGQLGPQVVQDVLCHLRVMVGDVEQAECRGPGVVRQGHLRAQLRQHQSGCHLPLRMGGMAEGKELHRALVPVVSGIGWLSGRALGARRGLPVARLRRGLAGCGLGCGRPAGVIARRLRGSVLHRPGGDLLELLGQGAPPLQRVDHAAGRLGGCLGLFFSSCAPAWAERASAGARMAVGALAGHQRCCRRVSA